MVRQAHHERPHRLTLCETHCEQFTAISKDTTSRVVLGEIGCVKNADDLPADAAILQSFSLIFVLASTSQPLIAPLFHSPGFPSPPILLAL